jgi:cysteine desulfurase / selenocysteine lyase
LNRLKDEDNRVTVYGSRHAARQTSVVSFNIKGVSPSEAALYFEERYGILCRPGLQCAPAAHQTIGTFPQGTIRFSFGYFNTPQDVETAGKAIRSLLIDCE